MVMKDVADAVGMPTTWDRENLHKIIISFEKKNPGMIQYTVKEAKDDFRSQGGNKQKFGEVNKSAKGRVLLELPEELHLQLEECLPSVFRSKQHLAWFIKNFPSLLIPEKFWYE